MLLRILLPYLFFDFNALLGHVGNFQDFQRTLPGSHGGLVFAALQKRVPQMFEDDRIRVVSFSGKL